MFRIKKDGIDPLPIDTKHTNQEKLFIFLIYGAPQDYNISPQLVNTSFIGNCNQCCLQKVMTQSKISI